MTLSGCEKRERNGGVPKWFPIFFPKMVSKNGFPKWFGEGITLFTLISFRLAIASEGFDCFFNKNETIAMSGIA